MMYLTEFYEAGVEPPRFRFFEFVVAGVDFIPSPGDIRLGMPITAQVTLGTVLEPQAICVESPPFALRDVPYADFVYKRWQALRMRFNEYYQASFWDALLVYLRFQRGLTVELDITDTKNFRLCVRCLPEFLVAASLPPEADIGMYVGVAREMNDQA